MFDYVAAQKTASDLLNEFGDSTQIQISRVSAKVADLVLGTVTGTTVNTFILAVRVPINIHLVAAGLITTTDIKFITNTEVLMSDMIIVGGSKYKIKTIEPLEPVGINLLYSVVCSE